MKVALCSSYVPFIHGGARNIVEWLREELLQAGHQVELIYMPHIDAPDQLFSQMSSFRWLDLSESADKVICFRPPSHVIPHHNKILWFIHHIRVFYDLWDSPYRGFPDDSKHIQIRDILRDADTAALKEAKSIFTNSKIVSERLRKFNKIESEVLYPPIFNSQRYFSREFGDEIVYVCRMEHHKRQHLMVEAMRHTKTKVKLRLCGASSSSAYIQELVSEIESSPASSRIIYENRWVSEAEKVEMLANALAAVYIPLDEDSYGYPSLEASHASKPVITTVDSGGVLELIENGNNGLVCDADPRALAEAMDKLYTDRVATKKMGMNANMRIDELNINWPHTLERLLA